MTNGEKLKEIFPDGIKPSSGTWMSMDYKEPTTKNDNEQEDITWNPCKDCSEKTWCGGFSCKEAREYLERKK